MEAAQGLLLTVANLSHASTLASSFPVQVTVMSSAVISSISTTLHFGTQGVLTANIDNTFTLKVQCTNTTPFHIGLDAGTGAGATVAARKMTNGSNINYSLYTDSARTTVWGNTVGTDTVARSAMAPRRALPCTVACRRKPPPLPESSPYQSRGPLSRVMSAGRNTIREALNR